MSRGRPYQGAKIKAPLSSGTPSKDASANSSFTLMSVYAKLLKQDTLLKYLGKMKCPVSVSQCFPECLCDLKLGLTEVCQHVPSG